MRVQVILHVPQPNQGPVFDIHPVKGAGWSPNENFERLELESSTTESYVSILDRAIASLSMRPRQEWQHALGGDYGSPCPFGLWVLDEKSKQPLQVTSVLNDSGRLTWYFDPRNVTPSDVRELRDRGLLSGDPLSVLLFTAAPAEFSMGGNGIDHVLQFFIAHSGLVDVAASYATVLGLLRIPSLVRGMRRLAEVGADTEKLEILTSRRRSLEEAATLLGLETADVPTILYLLGMDETIQGLWEASYEPAKKELREFARILGIASNYMLPSGALSSALNEITAYEVGDRAVRAPSILDRHQSYPQAQPNSYIVPSVQDNGDLIVTRYHESGQSKIGYILQLAPGLVKVRLEGGGFLSSRSGTPMTFRNFEEAIHYLESLPIRWPRK